jgi:hypothetical protein
MDFILEARNTNKLFLSSGKFYAGAERNSYMHSAGQGYRQVSERFLWRNT